VDLNDAVTQVCGLLHSEIVVKKARIDLDLEEALPMVMAGRVEIQQVLINLILNSLDAMKAAGCHDARIHISTRSAVGRVMLCVRDNGPGIPEEMKARLFEAFVTTKPGGLGLGLAISHGIIRRFEGELSGENPPGGGALFRITLPAVP
jgi:C4-dicarboxylate-specific signal transduction histidine kinase